LSEAFFRLIKAAAALANVFTTGPILAVNAFRAAFQLLRSEILSVSATFSQFLDTLGLTDGVNTKALTIALAEVNDELANIALTVEETDTGKLFNGIANGADKAIKVSDKLAGTFVGTFEKARGGIDSAVAGFDGLKKEAGNAGKSIKAVGDIAEEEGDAIAVSNKDALESYKKIDSAIDSLAKEIDSKTLTAQQGAEQELKRQKELVARGASQTLKSKHLIQTDGYGWAVDLLPLQKDGSIDWEDTDLFDALVHHMLQTAKSKNIRIRSGADWDMDGIIDATQVADYKRKHGKAPFVDRPHYEVV
jgi:peptidoglycan L-alanyl-D-glutamate endopeptidase CwlK